MIKVGIIGAGRNAATHAYYFRDSARTKLVAIADPDRGAAERLAGETHCQPVSDYTHFLDSVDAVVVSSPNYLHFEHATTCAQAGKHVFCEKPMGLSVVEAQGIAEAVQEAKVASQIGFTVRFQGEIQTMLRYQAEGQLGNLVSITSRRLCYIAPTLPGWRTDPRLSGGLLYEINIHELEWMMALGGRVKSVFAQSWALDREYERANDHIWVTLAFETGATGSHEGSWLSSNPNYYRACEGTKAGLSTNEWGEKLYFATRGENRGEVPVDAGYDLRGNFLDAIEGVAPAVASAEWGLQVMSVAEAVLESAKIGHKVDVA